MIRRFPLARIAVILGTITISHAQSCLAPPSGLVSWWPGDTNNNDVIGKNNPNNVSGVTLVPAEVSNGFSVGKGGYLEIAPSKTLANQNFTWSAWVKPLGAGPNNDGTGDTIVAQDIDNYSLAMAFYWRAMDNRFFFIFGTSGTESFASKDTYQTGVFYHVATTYDGSAFRLYVNGVLEGSFSESKTVAYSTENPWTIGSAGQQATASGFSRTFNGIVDEVQAFNRALTQSELQAIYNAGSAGECKPAPQIGTGVITGPGSPNIVNSATYANPAMPNALVAQGSLFTIFGSNLGPSSSPSLSFPLSATLGGTSVTVAQGSISVPAIPVFVSGSQINAIMPSNAPLGTVSVSVSYGGQTQMVGSANIAKVNFGIFTVNSAGSGPGILTNASYALIGYNSAAHPGDNLVIWGTGLGAISTSDANPPPVGNVGTTAPLVYFGGQQVTPTYYGRSGCCSGLDEVVFQVPSNVVGCNIPVAVQAGGTMSNFATVSVASSGSSCADPSGLSASQFSTLAQNSPSVGTIVYKIYDNISPGFAILGGGTQESSGTAEVIAFANYQLTNSDNFAQVLNSGACTVYTIPGESSNGEGILSSTGLDAGSSILASGGGAQGNIKSSNKGLYSASYVLPNGSITFSGTGGADVGAFSVTLPVTSQSLKWSNEGSIGIDHPVQRLESGLDRRRSQRDGADYRIFLGGTSNANAAGAGFTCTAPGPGQFTVPAAILSALPASANLSNSLLAVSTASRGISQSSAPVLHRAGIEPGHGVHADQLHEFNGYLSIEPCAGTQPDL